MNEKPKRTKGGKAGATKSTVKESAHRPPAQEISDQIIELIERDVFSPGERLREQDLADRFGVTRGRIREVLHNLEARGFVIIERMKGATIVRHDRQEFRAIAQVRAALLALAARRAAEEATPAERQAIFNAARELAAKASEMQAQEYRDATIELGQLICDGAHSRFLRRLIDDAHRVPSSWRLYRNLIVAGQERRVQSAKTWKTVAEAIKAGKGDEAAKTIEAIYQRGLNAMEELIAASGPSS